MPKLTDNDLKAILDAEIHQASGYVGGELSDQRTKALDYYLGEPFGNEVEGRSQVISTDVQDTIEWMLPSLVKTFTEAEEIVSFDPTGAEDEAQAEQETDYVRHVFEKDNDGFLILYTYFKDALLSKDGIVKIYWDESEKVTREEYAGLTDDELLMVAQDLEQQGEVEIAEHTAYLPDGTELEEGQIFHVMPDGTLMEGEMEGYPAPPLTHDVVFKWTRKIGKARIVPIPPEEFGISRLHNSVSLQDCQFCYHEREMTASELIEMGYDRKLVESLPSDHGIEDEEEEARYNLTDEDKSYSAPIDQSMRRIKVYECYIRVDQDGDGVAELRKITKAGNEILDNEEIDRIPFAAITPTILTHKFYGLSVADSVMDLQLIKSTIWRQMLDNMYLANNPRNEVVEGQVNLDDLLTSRPGGVVRTKAPGMISPLRMERIGPEAFTMLEYIDKVKEGRTGVSADAVSHADLLDNNKGDATVARVMTWAQSRVELIARVFAETGVKDMFLQVRELLSKHQDKQRVVKLRGQWVPVNPRIWKERNSTTVHVGLGTGSKEAKLQALMMLAQEQPGMMQMGLATKQNVYALREDMAKLMGVNTFTQYMVDPRSPEGQQIEMQMAQQQQANPLAEAEQVKGQFKLQAEQMANEYRSQLETMKAQMEYERKALEAQQRAQLEIMKAQAEAADRAAERASKEAIETAKLEMQAFIEGLRVDLGKPGMGTGLQE